MELALIIIGSIVGGSLLLYLAFWFGALFFIKSVFRAFGIK